MPRRAASTAAAGTKTSPTAASASSSPKAATPKRGRKRKDETDPTAQVNILRDETQQVQQQESEENESEHEHEHEEADKENQPTTPRGGRGGRGRGRGKGKGKGRSPRARGGAAKRAKTETQEEPEEETSAETTKQEQAPTKTTSRGHSRKTDSNEEQEMTDISEQKSEGKTKSEEIKLPAGTRTAILEKGRIYFFYRPKVDSGDHVRDFSDIQRMYILLSPIESEPCDSEEHQQEKPSGDVDTPPPAKQEGPVTHRLTKHLSAHFPHRLIIVPTKKLPVGGRPIFAFVDRVTYSMDEIEENLDPVDYITKTRGKRHTGSARPAGEGIYELIKHAHPAAKPGYAAPRPHVELFYELEVPEPKHMGMAQQVLNIQREGRMIIQVRNPSITTSTGRTDTPVPHVSHAGHPMPHHLQQLFTGKRVAQTRFIPCDPPEFLNVERLELLLAGVKKDVHDFGVIADELIEEAQREQEQESSAHHGHPEQRVMEEVHLSPKVHPTESLTSGKLV